MIIINQEFKKNSIFLNLCVCTFTEHIIMFYGSTFKSLHVFYSLRPFNLYLRKWKSNLTLKFKKIALQHGANINSGTSTLKLGYL